MLTWIESAGGPLVLMSERLLSTWRGTDPAPDGELTDYDRACAVNDYLGTLAVGSGMALVLGDEPHRTTGWPQLPASDWMLVRWQWANDEAEIAEALPQLPDDIWQPSGLTCEVQEEPLCLFDSAWPGLEVEERLILRPPPGTYRILTAVYEPRPSLSLVLHRFLKG